MAVCEDKLQKLVWIEMVATIRQAGEIILNYEKERTGHEKIIRFAERILTKRFMIMNIMSEISIDTDRLIDDALDFMYLFQSALFIGDVRQIETLKQTIENTPLKIIYEHKFKEEEFDEERIIYYGHYTDILKNFLRTL